MEDSQHSGSRSFLHRCTRIVFGIARVYDHRFREVTRQCELLGESTPLLQSRRVVVVVIESALSDRDGAGGNDLLQRADRRRCVESRSIVWMNAGGEERVARKARRERCRLARRGQNVGRSASRADADY